MHRIAYPSVWARDWILEESQGIRICIVKPLVVRPNAEMQVDSHCITILYGSIYLAHAIGWKFSGLILKGTATLMISMSYQKELYEPWILIQVSSKLVEKWASYRHLKNSICSTFSSHFEYLISFQNFFNCLIFSYHYYHIICVSADMQLYT